MKTNTERLPKGIKRFFNPESDGINYSKLANVDTSKLISDMIIGKAQKEEIERATQYSMVVMDARKKYGIDILEEKYCVHEKEVDDGPKKTLIELTCEDFDKHIAKKVIDMSLAKQYEITTMSYGTFRGYTLISAEFFNFLIPQKVYDEIIMEKIMAEKEEDK